MAAKKKKNPHKKATGKRGMPAFRPTDADRAKVEALAAFGHRHEDICKVIRNPRTGEPIDRGTLSKHFRTELETAKGEMQIELTGALSRRALDDDHPNCTTAAIFLLKTRFGFIEKQQIEHEGQIGGVMIAPADKTPEEWLRDQEAKDDRGA